MKVDARKLLSVVLLATVLIGVPVVCGRYMLDRLESLRALSLRDVIGSAHERVRAALDSQREELSRTLEDWTAWDAMYTFAQNPTDQHWRDENFSPDSMASLALCRSVLFDAHGMPVLHADYDLTAGAAADYPIDGSLEGLVSGIGPGTSLTFLRGGLCVGPDGHPALALVRPIRRSDKSGPVAGFLLMQRPLTDELIARIGRTTGTTVALAGKSDAATLDQDMDEAGNRTTLLAIDSWDGKSLGSLVVRIPVAVANARSDSLRATLVRIGIFAYFLLACAGLTAVWSAWSGRADGAAGAGRGTGRLPVVVAGAIGLAMTGVAAWAVRSWQEDVHRREFSRRSGNYREQIDRSISKRREALEFVRSHYHSSEQVDPGEFERLMMNAGLMLPGSRQWSWIPLEAIGTLESPADAQPPGVPEARGSAEPARLCSVPASGAVAMEAFLPRWPGLARTVAAARDSGSVIAVTLPMDEAISPSPRTIAYLAPVYHTSVDPLVERRRKDFRGVVVTVVELDAVLDDAIRQVDYGGLAARITGVCARPVLPLPVLEDSGGLLQRRCSVEISDGLSMDVAIAATEQFRVGLETAVMLGVGAAGVVLTGLLCAFIELNLQRTRGIEQLVARRTGELEERTRQLTDANVEIQAAHRAKSAFLANMSHELRTPMTAILGYSDLLFESQHGVEARQDFIRTIRRSGEHLLSLINDVLDLSKIEAGRLTIERLECRTGDLLVDVVNLLRDKAQQKRIQLAFEAVGSIPVTVRTDPTRFRQILVNLVGNAVKFTESGGVRLVVRLVDDPSDPDPLMSIEVIDTGPGIDAGIMSRLFTPFEQGDGSTTRRFGGTGLGLSISRQLSEMLGGTITASSIPGEGSTFTFSFRTGPLAGVQLRPMAAFNAGDRAPDESAHVPAPDRDGVPEPQIPGARILLAEDTIDNQRLLCLHLKRLGCDVVVAGDGQEATDAVHQADASGRPFDLVLMDMQMPIMDGYEATRALRGDGFRLPIVALTALASSVDRQRCMEAGCDAFISKPIARAELLNTCREFISRAPQRRAAA